MKYSNSGRYVAYICSSYEKESFRKVCSAVNYYNNYHKPCIKLVVAGIPFMEHDDDNIINIGFRSICESEYFDKIKAFLVDYSGQLDKNTIHEFCEMGTMCIVNEELDSLKEICIKENCGLYYSSVSELTAVLTYLFNEETQDSINGLCKNACNYACDNMQYDKYDNEIYEQIIHRKSCIDRLIENQKAQNGSSLEKLMRITSQIKTSDRNLVIVCQDKLSADNMDFTPLLIFHYIKLYINPNASMYFTGEINFEDSTMRLAEACISELGIRDVAFGKAEFTDGCDRVLLTADDVDKIRDFKLDFDYLITMGEGNSYENIIKIGNTDVEYVSELIGILLYGKERCR